jgi:hypothetical protein
MLSSAEQQIVDGGKKYIRYRLTWPGVAGQGKHSRILGDIAGKHTIKRRRINIAFPLSENLELARKIFYSTGKVGLRHTKNSLQTYRT